MESCTCIVSFTMPQVTFILAGNGCRVHAEVGGTVRGRLVRWGGAPPLNHVLRL